MKLSDLRSAEAVHRQDLADDPAYRREYLSTRFANQVAVAVMRWRAERGLTQTKLAEVLGMRQPNIARLEAGEHTPSLETLARLSERLDIEFSIDVDPENGISLREFQPHAEPVTDQEAMEAAGSAIEPPLPQIRATAGASPAPSPPPGDAPHAALNLDEDTFTAFELALAKLLQRFQRNSRTAAAGRKGSRNDVDVIFRDRPSTIIVDSRSANGSHSLRITADALVRK